MKANPSSKQPSPAPSIAALPPPIIEPQAAIRRVVYGHAIERGHPLPPAKTCRKAVLLAMEPGDSTVIKLADNTNWHNYAKKAGVTIACRKLDDTHMRMWRMD